MHALIAPRSIPLTLKSRLVNSHHVFPKTININYQKPGTLAAILSLQYFPPFWTTNSFYFVLFYDFVIVIFNILFHIELGYIG